MVSQKEKELADYKSEVHKAIQGKSTWNAELLNELIVEAKVEIEKLDIKIASAQELVDNAESAAKEVKERIQQDSDLGRYV